jgi:peptidoglycan-associated lipoprotein
MRAVIRKPFVPALVLALTFAGFLAGCPKKKPTDTVPSDTVPSRPAEPAPPSPTPEVRDTFPPTTVDRDAITDPSVDELNNRIKPLQVVYFEYDSSDIDDGNRAVLQANANWLKQNPNRTIRIEGHADERGTIKYNLALGERRANSVREYLEGLGIAPSRMRIVSYGEERPAETTSGEASWRKNRRAEFLFES